MGAPRFRAIRRRLRGLHGTGEQVAQLERLHEVAVPNHAAILGADLGEGGVDVFDLADALVEAFLRAEDGHVRLHHFLHGAADVVCGLGPRGGADAVEHGDGIGAGVGADGLVRHVGGEVVADGVGDGAAEDDEVEEGVGAEAVGAVDGDAGGFAAGEEAGDHFVGAGGVLGDDFARVFGGDAAHVVVDGGEDGDRLFADVDAGEDGGCFGDAWETLVEDLRWEMAELEVDVVFVRTDTTTFSDLHCHGTGDDVSTGKILGSGCVSLHEPLALRI